MFRAYFNAKIVRLCKTGHEFYEFSRKEYPFVKIRKIRVPFRVAN
jgi:hypothetical protein